MTYKHLTYLIRGCAYEVYKQLGPGLLESVYENAMLIELRSKGLVANPQVAIPLRYKGQDLGVGYRCDILVENAVIIELKSVETLLSVHKKQLISYLKLADMRVGYLINFNVDDIDRGLIRIVNNFNEEADVERKIINSACSASSAR
ncbi:MAG: GxxExxY protein [Muribaculaceae bacterium]|nr:GxxExxY protein [Muribaculaceae bacterium]